MKKIIFIHLSLLLTGLTVFFLLSQTSLFNLGKGVFRIAVAAPLSGSSKAGGQIMLRGLAMCLDKVNRTGGINGRKIEVRIFDDGSEPKKAMQAASEIVADKDVLLVIGHLDSSTSIAAGKIYKKARVPAITASATATAITEENEWYFRTIPNNASQGNFIAKYINKILKKKSVSIVSVKSDYASDLVRHFEETAHHLGLDVKRKWELQRDEKNMDNQLAQVRTELTELEDAGVIFVAAGSRQSVKILTSLRQGTDYPVIGPDTFTSSNFIKGFDKEKESPGYYTKDVHAISMFLPDIGNEKTRVFRYEFKKKYGEEPSLSDYCYYDAMLVATEAIRISGAKGGGYIQKNRKKIRNALQGMYNRETGVSGVTADIYFNKKGNAERPLGVGVFENRNLVPAFSQYRSPSDISDIGNIVEKVLTGKKILMGNKLMTKAQVVHTGLHLNKISKLNISKSTYAADFYVWFRFQGEFEASHVDFINSVTPVKLEQPIGEKTEGGVTVQVYHVKADFTNQFDFYLYPFDPVSLSMKFRHRLRVKSSLIFVPDILKLPELINKKNIGKTATIDIPGWKIEDMGFHQNIVRNMSSLGLSEFFGSYANIRYSSFNGTVWIKRDISDACLESFLPIIGMILFLYLVYFIPFGRHGIRVAIIMGIFITNAYYHLKFLSYLPVDYLTIIECAYFTVYVLLTLSVFIYVFILILHREGSDEKMKAILRAGKIIHPFIVLAVGLTLAYLNNALFSGL